MMKTNSYSIDLLTESAFHASYLFCLWKNEFKIGNLSEKIFIRETQPSQNLLLKRKKFHHTYQGKKNLTQPELTALKVLYPDLSKTEEAMIFLFGIPKYPVNGYFLGEDLNTEKTKGVLKNLTKSKHPPFFFIFLDQILAPWWIEITDAKIINAHSAVLPYARGMHAIENMAITQTPSLFEKCAGATIHYIDTGTDTGPIIQAERLRDVFAYTSIWEVKAYSFFTAFHLLVDCAKQITKNKTLLPVGTYTNPSLVGPNFKRIHFTPKQEKKSEDGFLSMKAQITALTG